MASNASVYFTRPGQSDDEEEVKATLARSGYGPCPAGGSKAKRWQRWPAAASPASSLDERTLAPLVAGYGNQGVTNRMSVRKSSSRWARARPAEEYGRGVRPGAGS